MTDKLTAYTDTGRQLCVLQPRNNAELDPFREQVCRGSCCYVRSENRMDQARLAVQKNNWEVRGSRSRACSSFQ
ncbi:unnamed protein product [Lasius platythorax]|uniref:Uncharacterized protein n=1 Tax=Lasius platythorax TaxID=488582 RepID=A0AAV2NSV0_9HYME